MHLTIFDTPIVNTLLRALSKAFLKLSGWKVIGQLPANGQKCVLIAAPHTSNWDLPYPLVAASVDAMKGLGPVFHPTGDIEVDMRSIKAFYAPFKGKNADQFHAD